MRLESVWPDSPIDPLRVIAERKINEWIENGGLLNLSVSSRRTDPFSVNREACF